MLKKPIALLLSFVMLALGGCTTTGTSSVPHQSKPSATVVSTEIITEISSETAVPVLSTTESSASETTVTSVSTTAAITEETTTTAAAEPVSIGFSLADIPSYSGEPYVEVNNNIPFFEDKTVTEAFESYSPLDELGRCGPAFANICIELMPTEPRGPIGMIKPSGWQTIRYDDLIEGKFLYNRAHLCAYELTSENANAQNLITGTRYLNIHGMLPFENKVADYVKSTGNHVLYRVTPIFEGNNLVADGVLMEAYSVEDQGQGIQYCVFCYNVQPGIGIDYSNGDSWVMDESVSETTTTVTSVTTSFEQSETEEQCDYVVNTNTKKFHLPSCSSVKDTKTKNRWNYNGNRDDLIAQGYSPCKRCNP